MVNLIIELSKYINIVLIAIYTFYAYRVLATSDKNKQSKIYVNMKVIIFFFHFVSYFVLYLNSKNIKLLFLYGLEVLSLVLVFTLYQWVYDNLSKPILHNMVFLLTIGYVMLARLSYDKAVRQFVIASVALGLCLVIPILIDKMKYLKNLGWIYGITGIILLISVLIWGVETYGATNWIRIAGILFQPSEFVKILFVFAIGALLWKNTSFVHVVFVTAMAAIHVLVLVIGKDLGGALLYFVTYLVMLFVATSKPLYLFGGLGAGTVAAFFAYKLFGHVRVRVMAWQDPWSLINDEGYQVAQSLFAIGTGGWFGMGLTKGSPKSIPVVDSDFIFSAISEEMGGLFALCLILICINCFILFINIALKIEDVFYKLVALGLSVMYAFQMFLSIGGVIKFVPSTGVTLPFVSYGGSSIISSVIMFSVIQGMYVLSQNRNRNIEKRRVRNTKTKEKEK
ncbi:MAG: FtsW/RodA/SpoVE family cell cycle protein [Anaerocolumna sp.]